MVFSTVVLISNETVSNPGIIYVDDDGTADYTSIQEAIDNSPAGETIYVFSGVYYEKIVINKNGINLIGENKDTTIIDANDEPDAIGIHSDNILISDFTIRNAGGDGIEIVLADYVNISRCKIYNCSSHGIQFFTKHNYHHTDNNLIIDCEIYSNTNGISFYSHYYGDPCYTDNNRIINTKIYSNTRYGIEFEGDNNKRNNIISNCEVYNNSQGGIRAHHGNVNGNQFLDTICYGNGGDGVYTHGSNNIIANCVCYDNSGDGILSRGDNSIITNCVSYNNYGTGINSEGNNPLIEYNKVYGNGGYGCKIYQIFTFFISNSSFYDNNNGILIDESSEGTVVNCSAYSNKWSGIIIDSSNDVEIEMCSSFDNYDGIFVLDGAFNNTVHGCTIVNNTNYGIRIFSSNDNLFYNNYLDNINNGYDQGHNKWNISKSIGANIIGGSYIGGNYWTDYPGFDLDYDGIGNTNLPYNSFGSIQNGGDWLPLVYYKITEVNVTPSSQVVNAGETFSVDITIDPAEPIAGVQFNLSFDPSLLTANSVTEGNLFNGYTTQFDPGTTDNTNGLITDVTGVITTPGAGVSSPGAFASISFTSKNTNGVSPLDLSFVKVGNPDATAVIIEITHGSVQVKNASLLPISMIDEIIPYKHHLKEAPLSITTSITSAGSGIKEVSLYYRYSSDNATWTEWTIYDTNKTSSPYTWLFNPPHETGYYEFYSIAVDNSTFPEEEPLTADAMCEIYPNWDINMDKSINILDMIVIGQIWGATGEPGWIPADAKNDGVIDILDLIMVGQHWTG